MVCVLTSSSVERGFKPRSGQTKNYKIGICCFSAKHAALRRKRKDWLAQNQDMSEWGDMSIRRLLFQWTSTIKIQLSMLVFCKADLIIISLKINLFSPLYSWKIAELVSLSHSYLVLWQQGIHLWSCDFLLINSAVLLQDSCRIKQYGNCFWIIVLFWDFFQSEEDLVNVVDDNNVRDTAHLVQ